MSIMKRTIGGSPESEVLQRAEKEMQRKVAESSMLRRATVEVERFPKFASSELSIGRFCGKGAFCFVSDVNAITLSKQDTLPQEYNREAADSIVQDRNFMAKNFLRDQQHKRYVVKELQPSMKNDPGLFVESLVDLVLETRFLAVLRHPHIIKMRSFSAQSPFEPGGPKFFLVLDKLYDILSNRLQTDYKKRVPRFGDFKGEKKKDFWVERLSLLYDLSMAIYFLHSQNVVYRDLKPDNIGFDIRGDVKIFDFGLSRELPMEKMLEDGTYKLTMGCGSPRFMAPEVGLHQTYNESCDVYSFSILMWNVLKVETPFQKGFNTIDDFKNKVWTAKERPKISSKWPIPLADCMTRGWDNKLSNRPSMYDISVAINREIIREVGQERESTLDRSLKSAQKLVNYANSN